MTAARATSSTPTAGSSPRGPYATELLFAIEVAARAGELLVDRLDGSSRPPQEPQGRRDRGRPSVGAPDPRRDPGGVPGRRPARRGVGHSAAGTNRRVWVVDPLDGTINYANGIPIFCVSIGLVVDGVPSVGVVHDPARGETFAATADGPATLDGRPIAASSKELLSDYVIALTIDGARLSERLEAIRDAIRVTRRLGSSALALAYVGAGRFDAFAQTHGLSAWDVAAAGLIAERSGATVSDPAGGPWFDLDRGTRTFGVVAAPPAHHGRLLDLVRSPA